MLVKHYFTHDEWTSLKRAMNLVAADGGLFAARDMAVCEFLMLSGCRLGETLSLTVGQLQDALKTHYLYLPAEVRKGGKRDHKVLVTVAMEAAIRALLDSADAIALASGTRDAPGAPATRSTPAISNRYGERLTPRGFQKRLKHWCGEAGITDGTPHWFRHTRAMRIMRASDAQDPRKVVQIALGHADIRSSGVYTHVSREEYSAAMESADGRLQMRRRQVAAFHRARGV